MAKTLLLADDSVTIQKVVNISFASENVTLVTVDNGDDAVERARETRPDLILADVVMPGKSGYEVCEAVKADPELCHIPVLLLSGTFEAFDEERAAQIGAAGHVAKPFEAQTLVDRVNQLLAQAPPPAPAPAATAPTPPLSAPSAAPAGAGAAAQDDDSFDFFDDDLGELDAPAPEASSDNVGFDESDSAFAFGDDDLAPLASPEVREEPPPPPPDIAAAFEEPPYPDRTIAIIPDDTGPAEAAPVAAEVSASAAVPDTVLSADLADENFTDPGDELLAVAESDPEDSFVTVDPSASSDDAFDFAFESDSTAPESVAVDPVMDDGVMGAEAADVAQATVLDPNGASGFDVSTSDLDASFSGEALPVEDEPAGATRLMDADAMMGESFAAAEIVEADDAGEDLDATIFASAREAAVPEPVFEPVPEPEFEPREVPVMPATPAEGVRPPPDDSAARAESVLAEIAPSLQENLHDTLEKIAWESFGDITEKIVAAVVDRVEKIAWEVIPQLTEALVKEEIRRMKDNPDA